jgi:hypothetical protein
MEDLSQILREERDNLLGYGLGGQGVELLGWGEAFCPLFSSHLAFLEHVHELKASQPRPPPMT